MPSGNPFLVEISVQVSPLSVLFHKAEPSPPELKLNGVRRTRHVEAYKILGLVGSIIKSTTPACSLANKVFLQVLPPSVLL